MFFVGSSFNLGKIVINVNGKDKEVLISKIIQLFNKAYEIDKDMYNFWKNNGFRTT